MLSVAQGGNGPHGGARNSSFAVGQVRADGFAGVAVPAGQSGRFATVTVPCTGPQLLVTVDVFPAAAGAGSVAVGLAGVPGLDPASCVPIQSNATNLEVRFTGGADFSKLVGQSVSLQFELNSAIVYTFGFGPPSLFVF